MFVNEKSQRKMFFPNIFMNSEEFKDLGTLHFEKRKGEHYDILSPTGNENYPTAGVPHTKIWKQK
jgi:hypothetical protein